MLKEGQVVYVKNSLVSEFACAACGKTVPDYTPYIYKYWLKNGEGFTEDYCWGCGEKKAKDAGLELQTGV